MAEKRACHLCNEVLEDEPALHDPVKCEKTELINGRETIKKLKLSLDFWKDTWYSLRDTIGRLCWEHHNCPYEIKPQPPIKPNPWAHQHQTVVQQGKLVYAKDGINWKLVAAGTSEEAAIAVVRLMSDAPCSQGTT